MLPPQYKTKIRFQAREVLPLFFGTHFKNRSCQSPFPLRPRAVSLFNANEGEGPKAVQREEATANAEDIQVVLGLLCPGHTIDLVLQLYP